MMVAKIFDAFIPLTIFSLAAIGIFLITRWNIWGLFLLGMSLLAFASCFKKIPADAPHIGVPTLWGERIKELIKEEGWRFIAPFFPFLYNFILINVEKKNQPLEAVVVRTPDMAVLQVPIGLTWTPDKNNAINYLNSGGEKGVRDILQDIVIERLRGWAMHRMEGPQNFEDAIASREHATEVLVKAVAGTEIGTIPSSIPTPILFDYFNQPRPYPLKSQIPDTGENWEKIEAILEEEDKEEIERAVQERRKTIKEIQSGNGKQKVTALGIILNRFNIQDIDIKPGTQLAVAAEVKVKEERERDGEIIEMRHIAERIAELMQAPYSFTPQEARDIVQTERAKVGKKIFDIQGLNLNTLAQKIIQGG